MIHRYSIDTYTYEKLILLHQTQANINYKYSTFNIQLSTLKRSNDTKKICISNHQTVLCLIGHKTKIVI